jgi:hypothetical protein
MVAGLGFVFAPINVAGYRYIPRSLRGAATGLMSLLRNELSFDELIDGLRNATLELAIGVEDGLIGLGGYVGS